MLFATANKQTNKSKDKKKKKTDLELTHSGGGAGVWNVPQPRERMTETHRC